MTNITESHEQEYVVPPDKRLTWEEKLDGLIKKYQKMIMVKHEPNNPLWGVLETLKATQKRAEKVEEALARTGLVGGAIFALINARRTADDFIPSGSKLTMENVLEVMSPALATVGVTFIGASVVGNFVANRIRSNVISKFKK